MIFLTLGTQLPFDRLVRILDTIALEIDEEIFGQIGSGAYKPAHFEYVERVSPVDYAARFAAARVVVGHAGMGTILTGRKFCKPVALMPRRKSFGEHRNDHQIATAVQMAKIAGVYIFETKEILHELLSRDEIAAMDGQASPNRAVLIGKLRETIANVLV